MSFVIHLGKENFKFSSTHFTIFSATKSERLHGHNYQVKCDLEFDRLDAETGLAFDFNIIKPIVKSLCDEIDERILIASRSPFLKIKREGAQLFVQFTDRKYSFPADDCIELPLVNITSEELARYFCEKLWGLVEKKIPATSGMKRLSVHIEETRGQGVSYQINLQA